MENGLSGLVVRAGEIGHYSRFRVGMPDLVFSHLQYVDDTLPLENPTLANLWSIKGF